MTKKEIKKFAEILHKRGVEAIIPSDWINTKTCNEFFGVKVKMSQGEVRHLAKDKKPMFFRKEARRNSFIKDLKKAMAA